MTKREADAWKYETSMSQTEWRVDPVHNDNPHLLVYKGGAGGHYFQIVRGVDGTAELTIGTYAGALPHIGEAAFRVLGRKPFRTFAAAEHFMMSRGGISFLLDYSRSRAFRPIGMPDAVDVLD